MKPSKAAMQAAEGVLAHLGHDQATHHYRVTLLPSIASIIDTAIKPLVDAAEWAHRESRGCTCNSDVGEPPDGTLKQKRTE